MTCQLNWVKYAATKRSKGNELQHNDSEADAEIFFAVIYLVDLWEVTGENGQLYSP